VRQSPYCYDPPIKQNGLVTGASRGIGRATALALAEAGSRVIVHYGNSKAEADKVVEEIRSAGVPGRMPFSPIWERQTAQPYSPKEFKNWWIHVWTFLVSNAGVSKAAPLEDHKPEDFDRLFAINVRSPFFLVQQTLPILAEGASLVLVSSLAARFVPGNPGQADAPSAVGLRRDQGSDRNPGSNTGRSARVVSDSRQCRLLPGVIETDMSNFHQEPNRAATSRSHGRRLKRIGQPSDVADVICFSLFDSLQRLHAEREVAARFGLGEIGHCPSQSRREQRH